MPASTVHQVLRRHGRNRLDHLDRATREPIRGIEVSRPGELVHVDIRCWSDTSGPAPTGPDHRQGRTLHPGHAALVGLCRRLHQLAPRAPSTAALTDRPNNGTRPHGSLGKKSPLSQLTLNNVAGNDI